LASQPVFRRFRLEAEKIPKEAVGNAMSTQLKREERSLAKKEDLRGKCGVQVGFFQKRSSKGKT